MVSTVVGAHMFCASPKAWLKCRTCWVDLDAIKHTTKYTTKMKETFFCCDQIKFNEAVLKPGTPVRIEAYRKLVTINMFQLKN